MTPIERKVTVMTIRRSDGSVAWIEVNGKRVPYSVDAWDTVRFWLEPR